MSFADHLSDYTAAEIIAATGCPRGTAYDWKNGRRKPPEWQQSVFLKVIASHAKRHNKTHHDSEVGAFQIGEQHPQNRGAHG